MSLDREKAPVVTGPASIGGAAEPVMRVRVVDFDMPFGSMVGLMVKWTIAAIPALLILVVLAAVLSGVLGALF